MPENSFSSKSSKVKIVHITTVHHPFDTRVFYRECQTLAQAGYEVVLVVPWHESVTVDQIRIHPIPKYDHRVKRSIFGVFQAYNAARIEHAAIYHLHDPELLGVAILLRLHGYNVVYDVHEDLPNQIMGKYWIPNWIKPGLQRLVGMSEKLGSRFLTSIITATPTIAAKFPKERTVTIHNFPILNELVIGEEAIPYQERPFYVTYVGAISHLRGAIEMVSAVQHFSDDYQSVTLNLVGSCSPESLKNELEAMSPDGQVIFWGQKDRVFVRDILGQTRVGLVILHPTQSYLDSYPVKLFEYMAAGIPVVASDFPLWHQIIKGVQCGLLVNPHNPKEIADASEWLLSHPAEAESMGKRGQQAVINQYNWCTEAKKLTNLYRQLLQV